MTASHKGGGSMGEGAWKGKREQKVRFWQPRKPTKVKERAVKERRALEILFMLGWTGHLREHSWGYGMRASQTSMAGEARRGQRWLLSQRAARSTGVRWGLRLQCFLNYLLSRHDQPNILVAIFYSF